MTTFRAPIAVSLCLLAACGSERNIIQNTGSDTMLDVAQAWAERYQSVDSTVAVAVSGGGSGTGIAAMINGTVDIANSSRPMTGEEVESARANGRDVLEYMVGFDALAVFLHPSNPISQMTLDQLEEIYAENGSIRVWSDLGITVPGCPSDEIVRVSRQNSSGTYAYFQQIALGGREFELNARSMNGSSEVVDLVEHTPCAIGYSGFAYATPGVKMPCISSVLGGDCVRPSISTAMDRSYPIARPLFMYTAATPEAKVAAYMDWIMGTEGQCLLMEIGYAPREAMTCS